MSPRHHTPFGRIAFREKGKWWVAYHAKLDTMDGATELGRIRLNIIAADPMFKQQWMRTIKDAFAVVCREALGETPEYPKPAMTAPEHERGQTPDTEE